MNKTNVLRKLRKERTYWDKRSRKVNSYFVEGIVYGMGLAIEIVQAQSSMEHPSRPKR